MEADSGDNAVKCKSSRRFNYGRASLDLLDAPCSRCTAHDFK